MLETLSNQNLKITKLVKQGLASHGSNLRQPAKQILPPQGGFVFVEAKVTVRGTVAWDSKSF